MNANEIVKELRGWARLGENHERAECEYNAADIIESMQAQQQENEQLQAQNGAMREAIRYVLYHLKRGGESWIIDRLEPAIGATPITYHNPADVEALKQAREALKTVVLKPEMYPEQADVITRAIAAIDKIGGREDV